MHTEIKSMIKGIDEMTKGEIRNHIKNIRKEIPINLRKEYNQNIHERLFLSNEFKDCNMLFIYISFGSEIDTITIINKALQMNKTVFVPKVEKNDMNFYELHSLDGLIRSKFGILEPDSSIDQIYTSNSLADGNKLMILPGLAFDRLGNRIGYGAGYYDRYLDRHSHKEWTKLALSYNFQIMDPLTVSKHDIPADFIITPDEFIICKQ